MRFHQLAAKSAIGVSLVRVENRESESQKEKHRGEPAGDFRQHIGGLGAENIFGDAAAEGRAETLTFRALHQDHEDHEQGDEDVKTEQNVDQEH